MDTLRLRIALVVGSIALQALSPTQYDARAAVTAPGSEPTEMSGSAQSAGLMSQIAAQLGRANGIRAHFTQTQTRAALKQPLVSSGTLLLVHGRGIVWHIETPYQAAYLITDAGVDEINAAGQRVGGAGPHGTPGTRGVAEVSRMMRAMLSGDLSALYSQFDVQAVGTPAQWRVQLTPNQPQLALAIKVLQMSGNSYLRTLRITLANGDVTTLDFADSAEITDLTPVDQRFFGAP